MAENDLAHPRRTGCKHRDPENVTICRERLADGTLVYTKLCEGCGAEYQEYWKGGEPWVNVTQGAE